MAAKAKAGKRIGAPPKRIGAPPKREIERLNSEIALGNFRQEFQSTQGALFSVEGSYSLRTPEGPPAEFSTATLCVLPSGALRIDTATLHFLYAPGAWKSFLPNQPPLPTQRPKAPKAAQK